MFIGDMWIAYRKTMTTKNLDITGNVSPYCILVVQKQAKAMKPSDELIITCDHLPAATTIIPQLARDEGMSIDVKNVSPNVWVIRLNKK